jgi:TonB family protein
MKVAGPKAEQIAAGSEALKAKDTPKNQPAAAESAPKREKVQPAKEVAQAPTPPKHEMTPKIVAPEQNAKTVSMAPKTTAAPAKPAKLPTSSAGTIPKVVVKQISPEEKAAMAALAQAKGLKAALSGFKSSVPEGLVKGESNGKASSDNMFQSAGGAGGAGMSPSEVRPLISGGGVKVEGIGGHGGSGGGQGYGVGGVRGSVGGQGGSFVALGEGGGFKADEGLTKEEVGAVIYSHMGEVRYCHEAAMLQNPKTEGKLMIQFRIDPAGRVETAGIESSSVTPGTLDECVRSRLMTWRFPKPRGGVHVTVSYPFLFKTLERE